VSDESANEPVEEDVERTRRRRTRSQRDVDLAGRNLLESGRAAAAAGDHGAARALLTAALGSSDAAVASEAAAALGAAESGSHNGDAS